jgi:hypothetical protein
MAAIWQRSDSRPPIDSSYPRSLGELAQVYGRLYRDTELTTRQALAKLPPIDLRK